MKQLNQYLLRNATVLYSGFLSGYHNYALNLSQPLENFSTVFIIYDGFVKKYGSNDYKMWSMRITTGRSQVSGLVYQQKPTTNTSTPGYSSVSILYPHIKTTENYIISTYERVYSSGTYDYHMACVSRATIDNQSIQKLYVQDDNYTNNYYPEGQITVLGI